MLAGKNNIHLIWLRRIKDKFWQVRQRTIKRDYIAIKPAYILLSSQCNFGYGESEQKLLENSCIEVQGFEEETFKERIGKDKENFGKLIKFA